jgi:RNA polymerase-binding protein DksA
LDAVKEALLAERATHEHQRDVSSRRDRHMSDAANHVVVEIDRALERIENGTYGSCEWCGKPVGDERLAALPYAALCIACQSQQGRGG